ncbi:MAG: hypothetical protein BWY69_01229 [Planctomycetes bacterium ADurb.Bin401]|nr:MAG: hypothetical protein BWY69_01229 [Planctomycetes bacterium ADurb.Bin401]
MKKEWTLLVLLVTAVVVNSPVFAQTSAAPDNAALAAAAGPKSGFEQFRDWFHNPTDWLSMGADVRWRHIYAENIDTLNQDALNRDNRWHFTRNRFRFWTKTKFSDDVDFNIRWAWEFRNWDEPTRKDRSTNWDEVIWDNFNLTVRNLFDLPLTMVAGRQDMVLGKGWLVAEGGPLDGSRTAYFDALRFTYDVPDRQTKIDMVYIFTKASEDAWLRPMNYQQRHITQQDEQGVIIYVTDKTNPNLQLEGYFIYKHDNPIDTQVTDIPDPWPGYWSKKAEIFTLGGALSGPIGQSEHWKFRSEGAVQFGKKQTQQMGTQMRDMQAFGTVNRIEYHFNDAKKNVLRGTFEYLSGDDPDNSKNTAFDPLWGEWPQWSELYIYTYLLETMIGETTNLFRLNVGHSTQLTEKITMDTDYNLLWADENTEKNRPHQGVIEFSNSGKFRGHLATWWLKYQITKNLRGHFNVEYFMPGNYYRGESSDNALWTRVNLEYTF